ncbi:sigma-54-dependent transcriptional regulator [Flavobacterium phragmitis]|uniref:DNA-binding transcriptional response regulator, NtrC family, contains REC, AAA-type ATPase, and a Fis-type DNA-binding domains n=1 Tax=Flavobacterium phragmitis TaxID=739143 RepID=A0A1I1T502_9FLAO|nr:sigma-54 dependent transcriptional regulator [Flavobacterium phragmitis]SFD53701.1 DNA-binding transcriptional response regulator, NtrC family, contains REC, AAA-type ATPase, and a Fis-type DNA-binding domains [Flavobacterium phragmitis]
MTSRKENILIVDDNTDMLDLIQRQLKSLNYRTYKASSVTEAVEVLKLSSINLLITDINMPDINGIELIKYTEEHYPFIPKLVISGVPSVHAAVNAIKSGALEYLTKPFTSDELHKAIISSLQKVNHSKKTTEHFEYYKNEKSYGGIIGHSSQCIDNIEMIKRVKDTKANILIEGESGTGKELIAKAIHFTGNNADKPFIAINCGGIPENLIESELFGHIKGSFTGALENRIGLFQAAAGGTIFLDEIGNAPLMVQIKLLRVLQEKEILRIGSSKAEKIDVRVISATNSDLEEMISKGTFRQDLYYRINVINIKTAPLRDRKEDIPLLVNAFIEKYTREYNKPNIKMDDKVTEVLFRYNWPGNIRELENIIHRMVILSDNTISLNQVPDRLKYHISGSNNIFKSLKEYEKEQIIKVLSSVNNNKTKAAQILKIDRKTLNQKMK